MRRLIWSILLLMALVACGSETSPIIVSPLPTDTPMTQAPTTPTNTASPAPTSTPPPTIALNSGPATAGPSPTSPLGATFTPAPPTLTITAAPTFIGLDIVRFDSDSELISPGDNIRLFWRVEGADTITIYPLDSEGDRGDPLPVDDNEGQLTVSTDPTVLEAASFVLVAERGDVFVEDTLSIDVNCTEAWFFTPAPGGCPNGPATASLQVEERFEGGLMIWIEATRDIYVFFTDLDTPRWMRVPDTFQEGEQERDDNLDVPAGRLQPVRGFGKVWRDNPQIRERLGWALGPEVAYDGMIQISGQAEENQTIYIRSIEGGILELQPEGSEWRVVPPTDESDN